MSSGEIRERLEHEARNARDSRTRLNALKLLQELNEPGGDKQAHAARSRQFIEESGYYFAPGALVLERRQGRFRAFERTRSGWEAAPVDLETQAGRLALLVALVEVFRGVPLSAAKAAVLGDLLATADGAGGQPGDRPGASGAELALKQAGSDADEDTGATRPLPDGVVLLYPLPKR